MISGEVVLSVYGRTIAKSFYKERLNNAGFANKIKRNNSNYKEVYISPKLNLYLKKSYPIVKLDSIQE